MEPRVQPTIKKVKSTHAQRRTEIWRLQRQAKAEVKAGVPSARERLGFMLEAETKFRDYKIIVHGKVVPAHKCVLAAHSPVFAKMIELDLNHEASEVTIKDFSLAVIEEALRFFYTGDTRWQKKKNTGFCCQLLKFASKYNIPHLTEHVLERIVKNKRVFTKPDIRMFIKTGSLLPENEGVLFKLIDIFCVMKGKGAKEEEDKDDGEVNEILAKGVKKMAVAKD